MKRVGLFFIFNFLFLFSIAAQDNSGTVQEKEETSSDGKNFFIGAGIQGIVYCNDDAQNYSKVWQMPSLGGNLFVGKWFSHKVGGRVFFEGGTLHPFFQKYTWMEDEKYVAGRLDFLLNLTNCFRSYSPDRFYNLVPYLGIGAGYAFNADDRPDNADNFTSLLVGGGLLNTFRLSHHLAAFVNLQVNGTDAKFDGWKEDKPFNFMFAPSIGLIYNFGKTTKKEIVPPPVVEPQPQPQPEPQPQPKPEPQPQPQPQPKPEPPKVEPVAPAPFIDNVFFRLDKSVIDADQQMTIKKAADFLKANPNAKLSVVGHADVQTGNPKYNLKLSERRSRAVAKELVSKYNISSDRLKLDWKGDTVQPFRENDRNRVVILTE